MYNFLNYISLLFSCIKVLPAFIENKKENLPPFLICFNSESRNMTTGGI
jgi:hypothetical protein